MYVVTAEYPSIIYVNIAHKCIPFEVHVKTTQMVKFISNSVSRFNVGHAAPSVCNVRALISDEDN